MTLRLCPPARPAAILGLLTLGLTTAFLASPGARAEESKNLVSLQVRVLQDGAPLDADLDLTFEIHDVSSGGTPLWSETQTDVPVRNGILATTLGGITSLGNVFRSGVGSSSDRWVAIKQNSDEIVPRVKLTAVPYAQGATAADVASAIWNSSTGTALAITDIPSAIYGQGLEAASGLLRLAPATGAGLTGGGDDPLAVDPAAFVNSGNAVIDGDRLQIDFSPSNYTRNPASPAQSVNELAAHLRGIDEALVGGGGGGGGGGDTESLNPGGRLTLSSTEPVPSSDISAVSTIWYLPFRHERIALWDSGASAWVVRDIGASGSSLDISGAASQSQYDVFAYPGLFVHPGWLMGLKLTETSSSACRTSFAKQRLQARRTTQWVKPTLARWASSSTGP